MSVGRNGARYRVSMPGKVVADIKALKKQVASWEKWAGCVEALMVIDERLRADPLGFGELVRKSKHAPLIEHVRLVGPLLIRFAIRLDKPIVYLLSVSLHA